MATSLETIRTVRVVGKSEGLEKVKADLDAVAGAQQNVAASGGQMATVTDAATRRTLSVSDALERHRRSLDATYRAQLQYERVQRDINRGIDAGIPGLERLAMLNQQRYQQSLGNLSGVGKAAELSSGQIANMTYQLNDVAVSLASGQSPFTVLMQQGMQLGQIFGPGSTLRTAAASIGTAFLSMLNPINLAVVGIAAAAGAASLAWRSMEGDVDSAEEALKRHDSLIRGFKDAYGEAAKGLREYTAESRAVLDTRLRGGLFEAQARFNLLVPDTLGELGLRSRGRFSGRSEFEVFREEIEAAGRLALEGKPAFMELYDAVSGRANANPGDSELTKIALRLFDIIEGAREAEARLKAVQDAQRLAIPSDDRREAIIDSRQSRRGANEAAGFGVPVPLPSPARSLAEDPFPQDTAFRESMDAYREQTEQMRQEAALWGQATYAVELYRAELELLTIARQNDGVVTEQEMDRVRQEAVARAQAAADIAQAEQDRRDAFDRANEASQTGRAVLQGIIADFRAGADAATIFANALNRLADRMLDQALDALFRPANDNAPGGMASAPGGALWHWFSGMVGGPTAPQPVRPPASIGPAPGQVWSGPEFVPGAPSPPAPTGTPAQAVAAMAGVVGDSLVPRGYAPPSGGLPASGLPILYGPNFRPGGVDPRLLSLIEQTAATSPYQVRLTSGMRAGDRRFHGRGMATDVELIDPATGRALPNYQDGSSFRAYEQFAQGVYGNAAAMDPALAQQLRWGGYFSGPKGKYGALDTMHFDLAGNRVGMGGGSWAGGLTDAQRRMWPGAESIGLGAGGDTAAMGAAATQAATAAQTATQSFQQLGGALQATTPQVGGFGQAIASLFSGAPSAPAGGGVFGIFSGLFGSQNNALVPVMHSGGIVGAAAAMRVVNDNAFAGARRMHTGGVAGDEVPTILRRGEGVFTREQMAAIGGGRGGGSAPVVQIIDQRRRGGPAVEQKTTRGPNGEQMVRVLIRDENVKSNAPGGLNAKNLAAQGLRRAYVQR